MTRAESFRRLCKNMLPWRLRLFIQEQAAMGNIRVPFLLKQHGHKNAYHASFLTMLKRCGIRDFQGKNVCEMGPGSFLDNAYTAYRLGASRIAMLDIEDLADADLPYQPDESDSLTEAGFSSLRELPLPDVGETRRSYLTKLNADYWTDGLEGYKKVPDGSMEYVFSNVVVQHIRKHIFLSTWEQVYRFMRPGGFMYHTIDFKDMLGGKKNHLRFSDAAWEDESHYRMPMYTNRIQFSEMCALFKQIGFSVVKAEKSYFKETPCQRTRLAKEFENISDEDLMTEGAWIVLKK